MPTPNATWLIEAVREFARNDPTLSDLLSRTTHRHWPIGHTSCRQKTSGSGNWSDHAWGNALDIMRLSKWKDPNDPAKGNAKPGEPHYLDIIWAWLNTNKQAFDLRDSQMLWRVRLHWNHIHGSFNHRGVGTPPCDGGTLQTRNPSGGWVLTIDTGDVTDPPDPPDIGDEIVLKKGDKGKAVTHYQNALLAWDPNALPQYGADGDYGNETVTWVTNFQTAHDLDTTGIIDGVTADMLSGYLIEELPDHDHPHDHDVPIHDHPHDHPLEEHTHTMPDTTGGLTPQ